MRYNLHKTFDLTKQRPQVLLFGNGFFYEECNWEKFILNCAKTGNTKINLSHIPYSIMADIVTDMADDKKRRNKYAKALKDFHSISERNQERLTNLLQIPFDAILTTNYTYQIENHINNRFTKYSDSTLQKKFACCANKQAGSNIEFTVNTFNRVENEDISQDIWHIHGEARRSSSIVLTHNEYGRLVEAILSENKAIGNKYEFHKDEVHFKSWVDYFLMGDVYILGLGMDYSEFDLWWLLARRVREKAEVGKMVFYEPYDYNNGHKYTALKQLNVECETLNLSVPDNKDETGKLYSEFYNSAISDISKKVQSKR